MYCLCLFDQLVANLLTSIRCDQPKSRRPLNHIGRQMKAIEIVAHYHVKRRRRPLLLVAVFAIQARSVTSNSALSRLEAVYALPQSPLPPGEGKGICLSRDREAGNEFFTHGALSYSY